MARKEYMVVDVVDILRRVQNGYSIRAVTRAMGMDRNTLRKGGRQGHPFDFHILRDKRNNRALCVFTFQGI